MALINRSADSAIPINYLLYPQACFFAQKNQGMRYEGDRMGKNQWHHVKERQKLALARVMLPRVCGRPLHVRLQNFISRQGVVRRPSNLPRYVMDAVLHAESIGTHPRSWFSGVIFYRYGTCKHD